MSKFVITDPDVRSLHADIRELAELRARKDELEKRIKLLQEELIESFREGKMKSKTVPAGGVKVQATLVERSVFKIDEGRLKKALGAKRFNKVTKRVLDKAKLEEAIANEEIEANEVAAVTEEVVTPYIKVTTSKVEPE